MMENYLHKTKIRVMKFSRLMPSFHTKSPDSKMLEMIIKIVQKMKKLNKNSLFFNNFSYRFNLDQKFFEKKKH